ncbi:MAG TPA: bifunctional 4-hydroxy-2-oxoglutarate aldolase/2-dehydro-3-deoxy-phosphogluconate aldolase [Micromonosporaceae bacterium]|nr:bifunctional 4-hydroxy-2-oxoglutarate aldolase/2-dehydro-3-deoxy-phosphogluconate aldolase [Micromonosporaceae bacterium]
MTEGVIAIVRLREQAASDGILESLVAGGINRIEITIGTPDALSTVARWRERAEALIGVGSVRTAAEVERAAASGAQFLVTPTTSAPVLASAASAGVPVVCGALTPTEIDAAWRAGAAAIKVFPIDTVGGPRYVRAVSAPLNDVPLVPTGGVDVAATRVYAALGCAGVGVGSRLVDEALVAERAWSSLTTRAAQFVQAWREGCERQASSVDIVEGGRADESRRWRHG